MMIDHLINANNLRNIKTDNNRKSSKEKRMNFGPSLGKLKQLDISKKARKMIHYDCNDNANCEGIDDDIPDEDEVYIKENLLTNLRERQIKEKDHITESANEDLSIVNINVSVLFSEETLNNSKNSLTFNYSPDSTSRMNMTKDQFNSAKKTLRSQLNKSNSINNLFTEGSNSNFNTINVTNFTSRENKEFNNSPGNPHLMQKITNMLNKNRLNNIANNNLVNNSEGVGEIIRNETNNLNIQNLNLTNVYNTNGNIGQNNPGKIYSENLNKNLLNMIQEKNKKNSNDLQFVNLNMLHEKIEENNEKRSEQSNEEKNIFSNLSKLKKEKLYKLKENKDRNKMEDKFYTNTKKSLNAADFLSPPSSKKRLEDKFYNHTENKSVKTNNLFKLSNENLSREEKMFMNLNLINSLQSNRQKNFIANYKNLKSNKFDFSRYNFKSQDLTRIFNHEINKNKVDRNKIISTDSHLISESNSKEKIEIQEKGEKPERHEIIKSAVFGNNTKSIMSIENFDDQNPKEKKYYVNNLHDNTIRTNKNKITIGTSQPINNTKSVEITSTTNENNELINKLKNFENQEDSDDDLTNKKNGKNIILRDIKSLHLITQKALTTKNIGNLPADSFDDERKKIIMNSQLNSTNSKKALFIDDNSEMPVGVAKSQDRLMDKNHSKDEINDNLRTESNINSQANSFSNTNQNNYHISERERKQIINIININNNYNIGHFNLASHDPMHSITNPNSNVKSSNGKYNAFLLSKESSKSKQSGVSRINMQKSKLKNIGITSNISQHANVNLCNSNTTKNLELKKSESSNSQVSSALNNQNSFNLFKKQNSISAVNNPNNLSNIKNSASNTPVMNFKLNISSTKSSNPSDYLNSYNEFLNSSRDRNVPNTSKNINMNNINLGNNLNVNHKNFMNDSRIKDLLKSYNKDKEDKPKNKFLKLSNNK